jgi:hypothetical protein
VPTSDGCDDVIRVCFPDERLRLFVVLFDKAVDGRLKVNDGMKDTVLQPTTGEFCEETLDGIQPGT